MTEGNNAIELREVTVVRDGTTILDRVSFQAPHGKTTVVIGPNGAGKSTALRTIVGVEKPQTGQVYLRGAPLSSRKVREMARERAMVTQQHGNGAGFTVKQVVMMGTTAGRGLFELGSATDIADIKEALSHTGTLHLIHRSFDTLSGGEQQRVLVARAVAQKTPIVLLDEPTNHLDLASQFALLELIKSLNGSVIMALHDLNLAAAYGDYIIVMDKGHVIATGQPEDVFTESLISDTFGVGVDCISHPRTGKPHLIFHGEQPNA